MWPMDQLSECETHVTDFAIHTAGVSLWSHSANLYPFSIKYYQNNLTDNCMRVFTIEENI